MDKSNEKPLLFKPLNKGLGFHPFSDGLPYAPPSKTGTPTTGTGAVAAGRPTFAVDRIRKELAALEKGPVMRLAPGISPLSPALHSPLGGPLGRHPEKPGEKQYANLFRPEPRLAASPTMTVSAQITHGIGYSLQRFFAYILDAALNLSLCLAVLSTVLLQSDLGRHAFVSNRAVAILSIFLFLCNWSIIAAQEIAFGTSIGKRVFGLRLRGSGTEVFTRAVLFIPGFLFSGLGILMAVFDTRKRCFHDMATQLQPENS